MVIDMTQFLSLFERLVLAMERVAEGLPQVGQELALPSRNRSCLPYGDTPGIQVLSPDQVAEEKGRSKRHLPRMESTGELPRRRQIGCRRVGYFAHEVAGKPAEAVMVCDMRTIDRESLAEKLGLGRKTIDRLVTARKLPPPAEDTGLWFERDIDAWLLKLPLA